MSRAHRIYTVYTVLGDGNPYDVFVTTEPDLALLALEMEREKHKTRQHHAHGIYNPDEPEQGDKQMECEEAVQAIEDEAHRVAEQKAWLALAKLFEIPFSERKHEGEVYRHGLCYYIADVSTTPEVLHELDVKIAAAILDPVKNPYLFPLTDAGDVQRVAFCRAQAADLEAQA